FAQTWWLSFQMSHSMLAPRQPLGCQYRLSVPHQSDDPEDAAVRAAGVTFLSRLRRFGTHSEPQRFRPRFWLACFRRVHSCESFTTKLAQFFNGVFRFERTDGRLLNKDVSEAGSASIPCEREPAAVPSQVLPSASVASLGHPWSTFSCWLSMFGAIPTKLRAFWNGSTVSMPNWECV